MLLELFDSLHLFVTWSFSQNLQKLSEKWFRNIVSIFSASERIWNQVNYIILVPFYDVVINRVTHLLPDPKYPSTHNDFCRYRKLDYGCFSWVLAMSDQSVLVGLSFLLSWWFIDSIYQDEFSKFSFKVVLIFLKLSWYIDLRKWEWLITMSISHSHIRGSIIHHEDLKIIVYYLDR